MRKASLVLAAVAILKVLAGPSVAQTMLFADNFSIYPQNTCWTDGATFGPWMVVWAGAGCVSASTDSTGTWLNETPGSPTGQARSALTIGPNPWSSWPGNDSYTYNVSLKTVGQLSKNPKNWNVAWFIWNYSNPNSFYTIVLKTAGWELDKEYAVNGTQTACFLATGSKDKFPIGVTYNLQVTDSNAGGVHTISVTVSGGSYGTPKTLATVTDNGACGGPPYPSGNIALYTEAASADFKGVEISSP
jgi:hypothetical protein